ncbi:hypothetical protein MRX96_029849 [Rhipicephalus microplus]
MPTAPAVPVSVATAETAAETAATAVVDCTLMSDGQDILVLLDGIREAASITGQICVLVPSPDSDLLKTACWDLSKIDERHLQHHPCAAATSSSRLEKIRPTIERYLSSGHRSPMEGTTEGLRTCFFHPAFIHPCVAATSSFRLEKIGQASNDTSAVDMEARRQEQPKAYAPVFHLAVRRYFRDRRIAFWPPG